MKKLISIICLLAFGFLARGQTFQFVVKVEDERGGDLKGVNIGDYHVRTEEDGLATIYLPEGKTSLTLQMTGYIDQAVDIITSRVVEDNRATFRMRRVPPAVKKIVVRGAVTTVTGADRKEPVADAQVKLFYSGRELSAQSREDGSFAFEIPDQGIENYEWIIQYYHPDYNYFDPFRFTVPKTNFIELAPSLVPKLAGEPVVHYADFIINPIPWKGDSWDVLDVGGCRCVTKNEKGFQLTISKEIESVHLKIVRKGYDEVNMRKTAFELRQTKSAEYVDMKRVSNINVSRFNVKFTGNYSFSNNGLLRDDFSKSAEVMWHPRFLKNKVAVVAGLVERQDIETVNKYETLNGFVGEVRSHYFLVNRGFVGVRYYLKDFMLRNNIVYFQANAGFFRQKPAGYFNEENFSAERSEYAYVVPELSVGLRKNIFSFLALEGAVTLSAINVHSQSFTFNYFGSAYPKEDKTLLVNTGVRGGLVFYLPVK